MRQIKGIHHITAIAGPAQENLDFYAGILGMRLVKKSVNQDDPGTYHLFYADAEGHPGTDLTFFPWSEPAPGREGFGLSSEVSLAVPLGSLAFWRTRLAHYSISPIETRFGQSVLPFTDPHGQALALVEGDDSLGRSFTPWSDSPIPVEHQIRGLESARLVEQNLEAPISFLKVMGLRYLDSEGDWQRYGVGEGKSGQYVDLRALPDRGRGAWGTGKIHHIAWRVDDEAHQLEVRKRVIEGGAHPTPVIDRFWFRSVYFREPGGVLFEIATDGPGFAIDEDREKLGEALVLPPWLEADRLVIEAGLPKLVSPAR